MTTWLLIDIDGVINVETSNRLAKRAGLRSTHVRVPDGHRYKIHYDPKIHAWLKQARAAGLTPVWCSTWQDLANELLANQLGLEPLPIVEFDKSNEGSKVPGILRFLSGDRLGDAFVWIDDEILDSDRALLRDAAAGPYELIDTEPDTGWTQDIVDQAIAFAKAQASRSPKHVT